MLKARHPRWKKILFSVPLLVLLITGLSGCFRSHGHSHLDPEKLEKKLTWVDEEIAEELEIRPDQQAAYQALINQYKTLLRNKATVMREHRNRLKNEFAGEQVNMEAVGEIIKSQIAVIPRNAELDSLIDQTVAFYQTLNPEQQEIVRKRMSRHFNRWH